MPSSSREFENWVHDAVVHYGDSVHLCTSPLLDRLSSPNLPIEDRLGELRSELRRAIESLRPPDSVPYGHADWLPHRTLWGRCVQRRSPIQVCDELALSRATYYRYQAQAIRAVSHVLWERVASAATPRAGEAAQPSDETGGIAGPGVAPSREAVNLDLLLTGVQRDMRSLLDRQHVTLLVLLPEDVPPVYGDPATLRQIVLNALAGVLRASTGPVLTLSVTATADETVWQVQGTTEREAQLDPTLSGYPELALCSELLRPYGGRIEWAIGDTGPCLRFALPASRPPTVLVVEDDPDTIALYERCLRRAGLDLRVARDGAQLWELLDDGRPDLILLDVLMPREDGWLVLQRLQTLPEVADIPVIVCSVLAQPSLALTLGARQVLLKPVTEAALLQAVRRVLEQEDSGRRPPR